MTADRASTEPPGPGAVAKVLTPRAIAIIGVSEMAGTPGRNLLASLTSAGFSGEVHLVGRNAGMIDGRRCLGNVDRLPAGVDLAVLTLPAAAVRDAIEACVRRRVGAAVIFASGFAEMGEDGRAKQAEIARMAAAGGLALVGPNCLGYTNHVAGLAIGFAPGSHPPPPLAEGQTGIAVVAQSGAMMAHLGLAFAARARKLTYAISTGNEAGLGIEDFVAYLANDKATSAITVFAEHIRRPADFLAALHRARDAGKPVVLLHPGRSTRAREAARSHTGAMAGDHAVMQTWVADAGAVLVESLAEMADVTELLARFPERPEGGVGIVTSSGAFCGIALDQCDTLGLPVPPLALQTREQLEAMLPPFATANNPLDLTTQPMREPELLGRATAAMLEDPAIGSVMVAITPGPPPQSVRYLKGLLPAIADPAKPVLLAIMGDGSPLIDEFMALVRSNHIVLLRSPERALAATARVHGGIHPSATNVPPPLRARGTFPAGTLPEYRAKEVLAEIGIAVPAGRLAKTPADAIAVAQDIGYPVVLKAQAAVLTHKSDSGGVMLGIADDAALQTGWDTIQTHQSRAHPHITLDGLLVERMAPPGVEMVIAARREPGWGPVLAIGMGGVWIEALHDMVLLPAHSNTIAISAAISQLKCAPLLQGTRGRPSADIAAAAEIAERLGRFVRGHPEIVEIEINPLAVHPTGATALDALIVAASV